MGDALYVPSFCCAECGIRFGLEENVIALWKATHRKFHCPNGHEVLWAEKSATELELDKLRKENANLKKELQEAHSDLDKLLKAKEDLEKELECWKPRQEDNAA